MQTLCSVPAKLILSGEHSVLYDCPALSMAIQLYTQVECCFKPSTTHSVTIELTDFNQTHSFPNRIWQNSAIEIESRYQHFLNNHADIQSVLSQPVDLVISTLHHFDCFHPMKQGKWTFKVHSEVPIGRGLGSSASVIVGLLSNLIHHHDLDMTNETLLALARKIESRQHGRSSGIDPATMIYGGLLEFHAKHTTKQHKPQELKGWLIDTGSPESTTGQAVAHVSQRFSKDHEIWKQFENTTQAIIQAWSNQNTQELYKGVHQNQVLLEKIGVVPDEVTNFIKALSVDYQAVAKVCGSGSTKGHHAGILLCFSEQEPAALCAEYGYRCQPIRVAHQGVLCQIL